MDMWFVKMSTGDNPSFADDMNMRRVIKSYDSKLGRIII